MGAVRPGGGPARTPGPWARRLTGQAGTWSVGRSPPQRALSASCIPSPTSPPSSPQQRRYKVAAGRTSPPSQPPPHWHGASRQWWCHLAAGPAHCRLPVPRPAREPPSPARFPPRLTPTSAPPPPAGFQGPSSRWIGNGFLSVCACPTGELATCTRPCAWDAPGQQRTLRLHWPPPGPQFLTRSFLWWKSSLPLSILCLLVGFSRCLPGVSPCFLLQREHRSVSRALNASQGASDLLKSPVLLFFPRSKIWQILNLGGRLEPAGLVNAKSTAELTYFQPLQQFRPWHWCLPCFLPGPRARALAASQMGAVLSREVKTSGLGGRTPLHSCPVGHARDRGTEDLR